MRPLITKRKRPYLSPTALRIPSLNSVIEVNLTQRWSIFSCHLGSGHSSTLSIKNFFNTYRTEANGDSRLSRTRFRRWCFAQSPLLTNQVRAISQPSFFHWIPVFRLTKLVKSLLTLEMQRVDSLLRSSPDPTNSHNSAHPESSESTNP
jgi:hypothetical protein